MTSLEIDHFAVACETLSQGVEYVEDCLGVSLKAQGRHPKMGTHNRLLSLGPHIYLEVISIDPDAEPPHHPRWFDLDNFKGAPRLSNWICRTDNLEKALAASAPNTGRPMAFERGKYRWDMAVPADGKLPYDGAFPALIQWYGEAHPAADLGDVDCRLLEATIRHPDAVGLKSALEALSVAQDIQLAPGPVASIDLLLQTPNGERLLK